MLDEDPQIIVYDLLNNNWDESNTVLADPPKFQTGWYDHGSSDPQVSITNAEEGVIQGGSTGQTAGTGGGGVAQYRTGQILVNCWAGTYDDMEGKGSGNSDVSPKEAAYDMAAEVHRILQANGSGTTDDQGNKQLHSLAASDARRLVEDERDPSVFRYEVVAEYSYATKSE